jgi:hypothetical protein
MEGCVEACPFKVFSRIASPRGMNGSFSRLPSPFMPEGRNFLIFAAQLAEKNLSAQPL